MIMTSTIFIKFDDDKRHNKYQSDSLIVISNMSTDSQKISEMQTAIASLNATVATLMTEVSRLTKRQQPVMKTSIPLLPMQQSQPVYVQSKQEQGRRPYREMNQNQVQQKEHSPIPLSTLLRTNEEVTFFVYNGKDEAGQLIRTTAISKFDGNQLKVTSCNLVPSLVGLETQKPGEILYKFIEELKNSGHIKRTFSVAPWKLCFVERDGAEVTLDVLRSRMDSSE